MASVTALLAQVAGGAGPIPKGDRMTEGPAKYSYRGIESILAKVSPLLATAGVVVSPRVLDRSLEQVPRGQQGNIWRLVTLTVEYTFTGPDGDSITAVTCGEGLDPGDKAANKALTAALKQALTQVLLIADAHDDPDDHPSLATEPAALVAIRALAAELSPERRAQLGAAFREAHGSNVTALPPEELPAAFEWTKDWLSAQDAGLGYDS